MWQIKSITDNSYNLIVTLLYKFTYTYTHIMNKKISRIYLRNVTKFQKSINWTFKNLSLTHDATFYLHGILLHFLVDQNMIYIKTVMKMHSYRHLLLTLSCQMVTTGHTKLNLPLKAAYLFKCAWPFVITGH